MKLAASASAALTLPLALVVGCPSSPGPDPDAGSDAAARTVSLSMTVREYGTATALAGATVVLDGDTYTTDAAGQVTLALPANTTTALALTQTGFPDHLLYQTTGDVDLAATFDLGSDATLDALALALMLTRDPSRGQLSVGVIDGAPGDTTRLPGARIQIDATREAQLVFDGSAGTGFSPGDTTLPGSSSASIFVNVAPGTISPTITPPSGYTCDLGPTTVEVEAGGYTIVNYYCRR
jgi:hypothetical protein